MKSISTSARPDVSIDRAPLTIRDVSGRAGVSPATVSRVFNAPGKVTPLVRERVQTAARELGEAGRVLIRASEDAPRMKLVAYTAMAMPSERESLRGVGFDDIVIKPASRDVLLQAARSQLP